MVPMVHSKDRPHGRSYPTSPNFCLKAALRGWGLGAGMVSGLAELARMLNLTLAAVSHAVKREEKWANWLASGE